MPAKATTKPYRPTPHTHQAPTPLDNPAVKSAKFYQAVTRSLNGLPSGSLNLRIPYQTPRR